MIRPLVAVTAASVVLLSASFLLAEEKPATAEVKLGKDKIVLKAPADWKTIKPKFAGIVDYEFSVTPAEGEERPGRVTIGGAGGGVEPNIGRWIGQFDKAKSTREEMKVAGETVYALDVSGSFKDGSPFGPKTLREGYRLLAVIITTDKLGTYYIKFVGPKKTVAANEEAFKKMVKGMTIAK